MSFPEEALTAKEDVALHTRPHAIVAVRPVLVLVAAAAVVTAVWVVLPANEGGRFAGLFVTTVGVLVAASKGVWPLLVWRCTHWVFTNERVLIQEGVVRRERADLPLPKIVDHGLRQGILDRLLGTGTLRLDTAGDDGPEVLARVPGVVRAHTLLYELIEGAPRDAADEPDEELEPDPEFEPDPPPRRALPWRRR